MSRPLEGMKVIDITSNISGPSLTMILGDLGAEVIKIERPVSGDDSRNMGPMWEGEGVYYLQINRNKRSIIIDLKTDEGRELVKDLVKEADVFVENFRLGKTEDMGLSYEDLQSINPEIIYCSLTAYGQTGPDSHKPGYDAIVQAGTGIMSINGPAGGEPARAAVSILDQGSAMWGVIGILSALLHRNKTGVGQKVETSLFETGVFWTNYHLMSYMADGREPVKLGAGHAAFAPYGAFRTATSEIMIGISNESLFKKLCIVLGKEEWASDPRFSSNKNRLENRKELSREIESVLVKKDADFWMKKIDEAGVPSSIIQKISHMVDHPQTQSTGMLQPVDHPLIDNMRLIRLPISLSETPIEIKKAPPLLGEDTRTILKDSGLSEDKIDELIAKGIVHNIDQELAKKMKNASAIEVE
ncbi:CaiB/BaiF CoA-transferase family protein [Sporosarcina sp. P33]|uniref:CaiB/BaiF CoA transferase family protein n=1 Tax=Sporosarcina sp. P33 TaxID=1930764 RepID=UPI0009BDFD65|nr:CaiB/BaiF CoA-transferase family protein [Sporosarcina sp. P33]ARD47966.1 formyl-CoA transferase [Sporosarcina sp. P33]